MNKFNLSDRDLDTLVLYARLGSQEAAAKELGVHIQTVKARMMTVKETLKANSIAQALWILLDGENYLDEIKDIQEEQE